MTEHTYGSWIPILTEKIIPLDETDRENSCVEKTEDKGDTGTFSIKRSLPVFNDGILTQISFTLMSLAVTVPVEITLKPSGIVIFSFSLEHTTDMWFANTLAGHIYEEIKSLYHHHVHHPKGDDTTLPVVVLTNRTDEEPIHQSILRKYEQKMVGYPGQLKNPGGYHLSFPQKANAILNRITGMNSKKKIESAFIVQGEFKYAESFALHIADSLGSEESKNLIGRFRLASQSMELKKSSYIWGMGHWLAVIAVTLALFGIVLGILTLY